MTEPVVIQQPDTLALAADVPPIVQQAHGLTITDYPTHERAIELLRTIKTLRARVADTFGPAKRAADAAKRTLLEAERSHDAPLAAAEQIIKGKSLAYIQAEEEKRLAAERAAREAERRAAEERQLAEAAAAQAAGDAQAAEEIISAPTPVPVVVIAAAPKPQGIAVKTVWNYRIIDPAKLPRAYLMPDEQKIGATVRTMKGETKIDGVEVWASQGMSARAR